MKKNKKGFTLIELLAVIVILGVLLLIAVPAATSVIESSKKKAFMSNAKLAIEGVETVAGVETLENEITVCYIPLSWVEDNLQRGSLGTNINGYILVDQYGDGEIYYSNGKYSITGKDLGGIAIDDTYATQPDRPTSTSIGDCGTWYNHN